jgi:5-formyltetrahydrofolate cyclo-ligase
VTKDELRLDLRERRKIFVSERKNSFPTPQKLLEFAVTGMVIGGYASTRWEVSLSLWWPQLLNSGLLIAMPYLADREASMEFRIWDGTSPLERAAFGFDQPSAESLISCPNIVLIPLIGFDRTGNRLGQGAGHYDRYFNKYSNSLRIGIAWSCQELVTIPVDPWDVPLNYVMTEREWIDCSAERTNQQ